MKNKSSGGSIKNPKSVKTEMLVAVASAMTVTVMLTLAWTIYSSYNQGLSTLKRQGSLLVKMQASSLAGPLWDMNKNQADLLLRSLRSDQAFISAKIQDSEGGLFAEIGSDTFVKGENVLRFSSPIIRYTDGRSDTLGKFSIVLSKTIFYKTLMEELIKYSTLFILLLASALLTLYLVLNRLIIKPLSLIYDTLVNQQAQEIAIKLPVKGNNEFSTLAQAFNTRAEILEEYHLKIQERQAQLQTANENLTQARHAAVQANQAKSQFLANMSHELRTPLNAIIGYSEMLIEEASQLSGSDCVPELSKILISGKHLLELINDILDISKIEAGKMDLHLEEVEIRPLVKEISDLVAPLIEKNSNIFEVHLAEGVSTLSSDSTKIRQNLLNLISNAAKFTHHGKVCLTITQEKSWLLFQVKDTGIGMTPKQLSKIFDPFTQADSSTTKKYGGTGLGLTITKKFCSMLGGNIWGESQVGQGTTFFMRLPLKTADSLSASSLPESSVA